MSTITCTGTITTDASGAPLCTDGAGGLIAWTVEPTFEISQVLEGDAAAYFGAGLGLVAVSYAVGHALRALLGTIRG